MKKLRIVFHHPMGVDAHVESLAALAKKLNGYWEPDGLSAAILRVDGSAPFLDLAKGLVELGSGSGKSWSYINPPFGDGAFHVGVDGGLS